MHITSVYWGSDYCHSTDILLFLKEKLVGNRSSPTHSVWSSRLGLYLCLSSSPPSPRCASKSLSVFLFFSVLGGSYQRLFLTTPLILSWDFYLSICIIFLLFLSAMFDLFYPNLFIWYSPCPPFFQNNSQAPVTNSWVLYHFYWIISALIRI